MKLQREEITPITIGAFARLARLQHAGVAVRSDGDTVHGLVGDDTRVQIRVLSQVMAKSGG